MRRFTRITDRDGGNPWWIPQTERTETYSVRKKLALRGVPAGSFDAHGDFQSPDAEGHARMGFVLAARCAEDFDADVDRMLEAIEGDVHEEGLRKLWRWDLVGEAEAGKHFTWARPVARPSISRRLRDVRSGVVSLEMVCPDPAFYGPLTKRRISDLGLTLNTVTAALAGEPIAPNYDFAEFAITSTPTDITITNDGDKQSHHVIFRLESQDGSGFAGPDIENLTNGIGFSSSRSAQSSNDVLSINSAIGLGRAQYSNDSGATFADDTDLLSLDADQAVLMRLEPGANTIRYTDGGTPDVKLLCWWLHAYRD